MSINLNLYHFLIFIFFIPLFPLVQSQWLNILLLNSNSQSIYNFIYFLSGLFFPAIVAINSLNNFTYYKFANNINFKNESFKNILLLLLANLVSLSLIINKSFFNIFYLISQSTTFEIYSSLKLQIIIFMILAILLIINKTKIIIKKLSLIIYLLNSFIIWAINCSQYNPIYQNLFDNYISNHSYSINTLNLLNTISIFLIDLLFFSWSYISYKNNISNWLIPKPSKQELIPYLNISLFYIGLIIYYFFCRVVF